MFILCCFDLGQEYPAVVEFAPFQKVSKKKLKKKDAKAGTIEEGVYICNLLNIIYKFQVFIKSDFTK